MFFCGLYPFSVECLDLCTQRTLTLVRQIINSISKIDGAENAHFCCLLRDLISHEGRGRGGGCEEGDDVIFVLLRETCRRCARLRREGSMAPVRVAPLPGE